MFWASVLRSVHAEQSTSSVVPYGSNKVQSFQDSNLQCNFCLERERFPSSLCPSCCSWNHVCEKSLPAEVMTYLLLSSARIFFWLCTSSRPSGWPWHTHHTSSLSSLLTGTAVQRDNAVGQTFYMQSSRKSCILLSTTLQCISL